ncbi:MAG: hypothetical protein IT383_19870 [Deltaproteobacteria bacterium]|nr:hypothetical protein [Deltaproteobacteria bacterium]
MHVIAGTHVVTLGMDVKESETKGLLGFAIHRTDHKTGDSYWLNGLRTFEAVYPMPPPGALVSTMEHPIQDFVWADYTAKPDHQYTYRVVAVYGKPKQLDLRRAEVSVLVRTEPEEHPRHSIYFNRGVIGSQAYARKFFNKDPKEDPEAMKWLARGLDKAVLDFIGEARTTEHALRAAVYEFTWDRVAEALGKAHERTSDVEIVFDSRYRKPKPTSSEATKKAAAETRKRIDKVKALLDAHGLLEVSTPRTTNASYISHNKFIVLLKKGVPIAVWTGSTNLTESGVYGQSNVGHIVRDPDLAATYLAYWERLKSDPENKDLKPENDLASPTIAAFPPGQGTTAIFSPRSDLSMLKWYADAFNEGEEVVAFTAAFGINKVFHDTLSDPNEQDLRFLFLEDWSNNNKTVGEATKKVVNSNRNNLVAVGGRLTKDIVEKFLRDRWKEERSNSLSRNVKYVHTKYMLIDPLGPDPVVISGSANFSDASTIENDENMLVIRGDERVADIYLGEFMRLWNHHRFRYIETKKAEENDSDGYEAWYLDPTDKWTKVFYKAGTKLKKRKAFAGPLAASR